MRLVMTAFNWLHWGIQMEESGVKAHNRQSESCGRPMWFIMYYVNYLTIEYSKCRSSFHMSFKHPHMLVKGWITDCISVW